MEKTLNLLRKSFSDKRLQTYEDIATSKGLNATYAVELYKLNILICEELYAFIDCIEVCLRNAIHYKMQEITKKETWYDDVAWFEIHLKGLEDAKKPKYRGENPPSPNDVISRLNFGFWCHIFDANYEQSLWVPCLRYIFPSHIGSPDRKKIASVFKKLLLIRNRIAHFEPIIKNEKELLTIYNLMVEVINWMNPEIYLWFENFNKFKDLYHNLTTNSFVKENDND